MGLGCWRFHRSYKGHVQVKDLWLQLYSPVIKGSRPTFCRLWARKYSNGIGFSKSRV